MNQLAKYRHIRKSEGLPVRTQIRWGYLWWFPTRRELAYTAWDVVAVLRGQCNTSPGEGCGGYAHWRCAYRRWHAGDHRFNNYTWDGENRVQFEPIEDCPAAVNYRRINGRTYWQRLRLLTQEDR